MLQPNNYQWNFQDSDKETVLLTIENYYNTKEQDEALLQEEDWPDSLNDGIDDEIFQEE